MSKRGENIEMDRKRKIDKQRERQKILEKLKKLRLKLKNTAGIQIPETFDNQTI